MIKKTELFAAGSVNKPHGVAGELSVSFATPLSGAGFPFLVLEIDGILVPFFIESYRSRTEVSAFIKLEGMDTDAKAKSLSNKSIYLPLKYRRELTPEELGLRRFIGFRVEDASLGALGAIEDVEDSTANVLFVVRGLRLRSATETPFPERSRREVEDDCLIPATDDYITRMDESERVIYMNLPDGLLD